MSRYPQDYHIHTAYSVDSEADMDASCRAAIGAGVEEIAFADHLDFGPNDPGTSFPAAGYLAAIQRCRERYLGRLVVRTGIEIGEPHLFAEGARHVLAAGEFDVVLGSAHYAEGMQAAWVEGFFDQPLHAAYSSYFRQVVDLAEGGDFDILCHLDLVKRDARKLGKPYDGPGPYADLIRGALRALVERGKGIELNTSPLRRGQPEPCPSFEVLCWYRELGGEILTLGSDAHSPEVVGSHLDVAVEMARAAGFDRLATFERRRIDWKGI
jgi:histidinol-phosphatase (PHP family)